MSATATSIDFREFLADFIDRSTQRYLLDFGFVSEDKVSASPMGCARSPLDFTAECAGYNIFLARMIRKEPAMPTDPAARQAFIASVDTKEKATSLLQSTTADLVKAIREMPEEQLSETVTAPWGAEMPLYHLIHICGTHLNYHDGQLNYIQCLYGDPEIHWH